MSLTSRAKRRSDLKNRIIQFLTTFVVILIGTQLYTNMKLYDTVEDFQCHLPPDITKGGVVRVNEFYKHEVYGFVREIHQQIRRCETDCSKDYENNIHAYSHYYTESYKTQLLNNAKKNELRNKGRVRYASEYGFYNDDKVEAFGNNTFLVKLEVKETTYVGDKKVKEAVYRYPFLVGKVDIDRQKNPWKLQIGGLKGQTERIE